MTNSPSRIAIFCATLPPYPCGVGKHTYFLANALQAAGHQVTLVTLATNHQVTPGEFKLAPTLKKFGLLEYLKWARANRGRYDMVHLQYPTKLNRRGLSVVLLPWIIRLYGFRITLTLHELSEASLMGKIRNIVLASGFPRIILPNPADAVFLPHKKKTIHHITLGPTLIPGQPQPLKLATVSIGFLGFMDGSKGEQILLQALTLVPKQVRAYFLSRFEPQTNPHHAQLANQVAQANLDGMVEWVSPADDQHILDYLRAVDIVAMPFMHGVTRRNSTLLEAICAGKPVIVSDGGNLPDYLQSGQNCLTVSPGDSQQLSSVITRLVDDKALLQRLTDNVSKLAGQFDWRRIAQLTQEVYQR